MLSRAACLSLQKPISALLVRASSTTPASNAAASVTADGKSPLYQRPVRLQQMSPVRHGFIPEEFFTFFYNKTGVTGPYAFGGSLITYLISKEIYVMEHEYYNGISFFILLYVVITKFGPDVKKYLSAECDKVEAGFNQSRLDEIAQHEENIKNEELAQWQSEGQLILNDAHKENVALQLEAAYRERLANVYAEVKRRLDYQVEVQHVERRIKQKHLVDWVRNKVLSSITPDQEKENLNRCIADLSALATKA